MGEQVRDEILERLERIERRAMQTDQRTLETQELLTGNGDPRSGLIWKVEQQAEWIAQRRKLEENVSRTVVAILIGAVVTAGLWIVRQMR